MKINLSTRPVQKEDIPLIIRYWENASDKELQEMGIDLSDLPVLEDLQQRLEKQVDAPYKEKMAFVIISDVDGVPIGHCYVNKIRFGKDAFMHLHIWEYNVRKKGIGTEIVKRSIPYFFKYLELETLYCEPRASNAAPNRTCEKVGFEFVKKHVTIPAGWNFELEVNRWKMAKKDFEKIKSK